MGTDISNTGSSTDSKYLKIGEGMKERFALADIKIQDDPTGQHSSTIAIIHNKKEKLLNLPTVLLRQIQSNIEQKKIKKGSILVAENLGKPKGKAYFDFKLTLERK